MIRRTNKETTLILSHRLIVGKQLKKITVRNVFFPNSHNQLLVIVAQNYLQNKVKYHPIRTQKLQNRNRVSGSKLPHDKFKKKYHTKPTQALFTIKINKTGKLC